MNQGGLPPAPQALQAPQARLYVLCEKRSVKEVKTWLERQNALFKGEKIKPEGVRNSGLMLIPTTGLISQTTGNYDGFSTTLPAAALSADLKFDFDTLSRATRDTISALFFTVTMANSWGGPGDEGLNDLQKMFYMFLNFPSTYRTVETINKSPDKSTHVSFQQLLVDAPKRWTLYPPLIMLPPGSFNADWTRLLEMSFRGDTDYLWQNVLDAFSSEREVYTHIAVNKGIPLDNADEDDNTIRAPSSELQRLYGDFGPDIPARRFYLPPGHEDAIGKEDFEEAFWVTTKQNGLYQVWAPRWTMFSRGNVKEKARVLTFEKAFEHTMEGRKINAAALKQAHDKPAAGLGGSGPKVAGASAEDAMLLDSESEGQPSPRRAIATKDEEIIEIDSASEGVPSPRAAEKSALKIRFAAAIDIPSSPLAAKEPATEDESPAEKEAPTDKEPSLALGLDQRSTTNIAAQEDVGLLLDGDAPAERRPLPQPPVKFLHGQKPNSQMPNSERSAGPKRRHSTSVAPKLDVYGNPKFQEVQLAMDLYAGIGYFTMSYLKLGYDVIAYELNPFSVEGLRRGAKRNGFGCTVLRGEELMVVTGEEENRTLVRSVMSGAGKRGDPILLDGDEDDGDEGYVSRRQSQSRDKGGVVANGDAANEVTSDEENTLIAKFSEKVAKDKKLSAAADKMANKEPIVIDDDGVDSDNAPLTASQSIAAAHKISNSYSALSSTNSATAAKPPGRPHASLIPPTLTLRTHMLHFLESLLQHQFTRPPHVIVYEQSNIHAHSNLLALSTLRPNRGGNPYRVRHVNLGFLPSSKDSWDTAAQLVVGNLEGGAVHVHENVKTDEVAKRGESVREAFAEFVTPYVGQGRGREVKLGHTELVKTFAPGVWHVVYDVVVGMKGVAGREERRDRALDARYFDGEVKESAGGPDPEADVGTEADTALDADRPLSAAASIDDAAYTSHDEQVFPSEEKK